MTIMVKERMGIQQELKAAPKRGAGPLLPIMIIASALFFFLTVTTTVEARRGAVIIAKKVNLDKKVLLFNSPHGERVFTVSWIDGDGRVFQKRHVSRRGSHAYEMRDHPAWRGEADSVSLAGLKMDSARVELPDLAAEMDIFLAPEPWMRSTVNALWGHTLLGFSWEGVVLLSGLLFTAVIFFKRRGAISFSTALLAGFVFLMLLVEIRSIYDHMGVAEGLKDNESVAQTRGLGSFSRQLAGRIGEVAWSSENLPSIASINIAYGLAEKRYLPPSITGTPRYNISYIDGGIVLIPPGK